MGKDNETKNESGKYFEQYRQDSKKEKFKASAKVMRSYDYCHFEIVLGSDEEKTLQEVDDMRKEAARLVDKAVVQYQMAKEHYQFLCQDDWYRKKMCAEVKEIRERLSKSEYTQKDKAKIKALEDYEFRMSLIYDYDDDWDY